MKSKNDTPSNNNETKAKEHFPSHNEDSTKNAVLKGPLGDTEEKIIPENQEGIEQQEFNDLNMAFFLPKDLCENIDENDEIPEKENNDINRNNNFYASKNKNINNKYLSLNENNSENIFQSFNDKNKNNEAQFGNNNHNIEGNNLKIAENINNEKYFFQSNNNINNYYNYFVNNNNSTQINFHFNNNLFNNNIIYSQNNYNLMNFIPNNQPFYNQNGLINQNINNNYIFNNNIFPGFSYPNQFQNYNPQLFQINKKNNKQQKNKKYYNNSDNYTIEMFGREGWICQLCNNFNYESRKKCNRCHITKKPKKINNNYQAIINNSSRNKNYWICKLCGNYNFPFRFLCNRCQAKKEVC